MSLFSNLFHTNKASPKNNLSSTMSFLFGSTTAGQNVTERTAMQNTAVYTCVRVLAEGLAGLPLHVYQYGEDGNKKRAIDHPLYFLLHDAPNPEMTSFIFRETLMNHLLLWGNAYAQIIRDGQGNIKALYPLMPDRMDVNRAANGELYYTYTRNYDDYQAKNKSQQVILLSNEVLHIAGLGFDGLIGYSPIAMAKNAIGLSMAAEQYGSTFFKNDATPGGVLEHPNIVKDPERLRKSWQAQFSGANNHSVAVLEEGMTFHQLSIPPDQAQFLDTRKFQLDEIARIFRVPPHLIGDLERSTFSNIEQQSLEFVKYTLNPWCVRWEQAINQQLLGAGNYFVKFNVDGLMRGDYESRMNGYAIGRQNGWLSANDIRELEDLNKIPADQGGDDYLVNGNMLPLKQAGNFYKNTQPNESEDDN
ncbi:MAG: phage portal protein [Ligilactobacillus animalis]|uniref:phage portal protein n=1 Tax=Ligilactobacillus animalis TaxID=1605 RepID=UPI002904E4D0|nr:phage portal protein [Ligilactobacillus animalis]MDU3187418.1 phage portal protein [Ligilactobacillus animalis]